MKQLEKLSPYLDQSFNNRFPTFEWFRNSVPHTNSILNPGCGWGKESFALMWELESEQTLGVDIEHEKIKYAKERIENLYRILQSPKAYIDWLNSLHTSIQKGIKNRKFPEFQELDFSNPEYKPKDKFDLVYCRFFLWQFAKLEDKTLLKTICDNIRKSAQPGTGRIVIIEPTITKNVPLEYMQYLKKAGLEHLKTENDANILGRTEIDNPQNKDTGHAKPVGYIFYYPD